jgi:hypothetical protein
MIRWKTKPTSQVSTPKADFGFQSELRGNTWACNDQSVMIRVEDGVIHIFLRKIFKNLGFGPERG